MKHSILLSLILVLVLGTAGASAQSPVVDAYGGQAGVAGTVAVSGDTPTAPTAAAQGTLGATANGTNGAAAAAAGPSDNGVAGAGVNGTAPTAVASAPRALDGDSLPFTGFDVALLAVGGIALLALGFTLRRLSRQPHLPV